MGWQENLVDMNINYPSEYYGSFTRSNNAYVIEKDLEV
jgi:hypothetical protein